MSTKINSDENDYNENENNKMQGKLRRNSIFTRTYNPEEDEDDSNEGNIINDVESYRLNEENKEKSPAIRSKLSKILRSIIMFKHLCEDDFNQILDNMFERRCSANEVIIKENDDGNYFYVIDKGVYEIYKKSDNEFPKLSPKKIGEYNNSGFFGELALLYNQPRSATIISVENGGVLWAMNRNTFQRLVISNAFKRRKLYEEFLRSVPLLKECMNDYERTQVADSLTSHGFKKNDCIIQDGDLPNGMYFVEEGEVEIVKENSDGKIIDVILSTGDYFGELALINKTQRSASAYCYSSVCKVSFLEIEAFERLMGPCINVFKQNINNYRSL
jgi:cAMP-dependent protein kinase regulator